MGFVLWPVPWRACFSDGTQSQWRTFPYVPSELLQLQLHSVSSRLLSVGRATGLTAATGLSTSLKQAHAILCVPLQKNMGLKYLGDTAPTQLFKPRLCRICSVDRQKYSSFICVRGLFSLIRKCFDNDEAVWAHRKAKSPFSLYTDKEKWVNKIQNPRVERIINW